MTTALLRHSFAAQSTFVTDTQSIAFGLSIPEDNNDDLYFSIAMPKGEWWAAVGLGSSKMANSLVLMVYSSSSGDNLTFSPRLAKGHTEPEPYDHLDVETLAGTGLVNETTYLYNAICHNCRSWPGGSVDVTSTAQKFIYATGPGGDAKSDSQAASVKIHYEYGTFTMDMKHATGSAGPVVLNSTTTDVNDGVIAGSSKQGMTDYTAMFHAIIMIGCLLGLMPLGVLLLRVGGWVRLHGINQGVAAIGIIVGFALGVKSSTLYNRSRSFNTAHQIIGLLVFIFVIAQFVLGFMHHRTFKRTQQTTKFAPIHVWLGRVVIVVGVANGFLLVSHILYSFSDTF